MKHVSYVPVGSENRGTKFRYFFHGMDEVDIMKDILIPLRDKTKNWIDCLIQEYPEIFLKCREHTYEVKYNDNRYGLPEIIRKLPGLKS